MLLYQILKMLNRLRGEEHVGTDVTDFCWDLLKYHDLGSVLDSMDDEAIFVFARASLDTTVHALFPLWNGVTHFGDRGSYTVMIIVRSRVVVHTTWTYLLCEVCLQTKQQGPRLCSG